MTLSHIDRRMLQEIRADSQKLFLADQLSQSNHVLSSAMAKIRSLASSVLERDPDDITWKEVASVMKEVHQDTLLLCHMQLTRCYSFLGKSYVEERDRAFGGILGSMVRSALVAPNSLMLSRVK